MAVYDLERLSVFLVEDNKYVSNTLENMLRQLRFGRIMTASNGAETIEHLKTMHENPQMAASLGLDLVVSDLVMAPVNGLLLLRWMRSAKESPNRFIPFIMLSGDVRKPRNAALRVAFPVPSRVAGAPPAYGVGGLADGPASPAPPLLPRK